MKRHLKIMIEQHADGYVGSVRGLGTDIVLGEVDTSEQALADVCSALLFLSKRSPHQKRGNATTIIQG